MSLDYNLDWLYEKTPPSLQNKPNMTATNMRAIAEKNCGKDIIDSVENHILKNAKKGLFESTEVCFCYYSYDEKTIKAVESHFTNLGYNIIKRDGYWTFTW